MKVSHAINVEINESMNVERWNYRRLAEEFSYASSDSSNQWNVASRVLGGGRASLCTTCPRDPIALTFLSLF